MAQEITVQTQLKLVNGSLNLSSTPTIFQQQITQSIQAGDGHVVALMAGSDTAITINASVSTLGWAWFVNLDATNYVEWGPDNAGAINVIGQMNAGEPAGPFRLSPGKTLRMKAHSGDCKVAILVLAN